MKVAGRTISFDVKRTGGTGCDTPQVYLSFPTADSDLGVPSKELRFFKKTCDDTATLSYDVQDADVSNWDTSAKEWSVTPGTYKVQVGASSQDIRLTGVLSV